jgi:NADPH-dependent glutamate synthase beta subunit-like oxidoreductase
MEFLHSNTRRLLDGDSPALVPWEQREGQGRFISAEGKDVVVIGGGASGAFVRTLVQVARTWG